MFWCVRRKIADLLTDPRGVLRKSQVTPSVTNLLGDRDIEWSWIVANMPDGPGEALDFGCGGSSLGLTAAVRGFSVTAIDLGVVKWPYFHSRLHFVQGDILRADLPVSSFDLVISCSTVEHVGLSGRYGVTDIHPDGDLEAMVRLHELMKPDAVMLMTIPVGQDDVFAPNARVYGAQRLPRLLKPFRVEKEVYWVKDLQNRWTIGDAPMALQFKACMNSSNALACRCALGCFVLRACGEGR